MLNLENGETILPITDYEDLYVITSYGRVYSFPKPQGNGLTKGKFLKPLENNVTGYFQVSLSKNNKPKTYQIHRLVAQAFLLDFVQFSEGKDVNHIDGVKSNNHVSNLEMVERQSKMVARHIKFDHTSRVSPYYGVYWQNRPRYWSCRIGIRNKKMKYLGSYFTDMEAAEAWDNYLRENNIKGKLFNFPRDGEEAAAIQQ